jgi:Leucine-rich repeat (LRR) protein
MFRYEKVETCIKLKLKNSQILKLLNFKMFDIKKLQNLQMLELKNNQIWKIKLEKFKFEKKSDFAHVQKN